MLPKNRQDNLTILSRGGGKSGESKNKRVISPLLLPRGKILRDSEVFIS